MVTKRNPIARDLRSPKYKKRVVSAKRGKGSYKRPTNRRPEHLRDGDFLFPMLAA